MAKANKWAKRAPPPARREGQHITRGSSWQGPYEEFPPESMPERDAVFISDLGIRLVRDNTHQSEDKT